MGKLYRYQVSRWVAAHPAAVWDVVSTHAGMFRWTPYRKSILEREGANHPNGVGAIRALYLLGRPTREQITAFEPPHRLRYTLLSGLPFRDYTGEVTVEPDGSGSRLHTRIAFRTRIPGSQLFGPVAVRIATKKAARLAERGLS
jgi:uncharacterized protein YndB with AHSA1/START domain